MQYIVDQRINDFQFHSQLGQDLWVMLHTNFKKHGYFVEIGAANGIELSNTYTLEQFLSWGGICIEPMNQVDQLRRNRSCIVDDSCVWARSGEQVDFLPRGLLGGIVSERDMDRERKGITLNTISLDDLLEKHNAPQSIDYISIDTEGTELDIISNFDLNKYSISLISIEHNGHRKGIDIYLNRYGYSRLDHQDFTRQYYKNIVFAGRADLDQMHYPNSETGGDYDDWYVKIKGGT